MMGGDPTPCVSEGASRLSGGTSTPLIVRVISRDSFSFLILSRIIPVSWEFGTSQNFDLRLKFLSLGH